MSSDLVEPRQEAPGLAWLVRHYVFAALFVISLTTGTGVAAAYAVAAGSPYEATALVIAQDLQIRPEQLPRFAESVFASGSVARQVADTQGLSEDFRDLVPDVIDVDPVPESISLLVRGRADEPGRAATLADSASQAFLVQLNRAGAGVGTFALQDSAVVPVERTARGPGPVLGGLVSLIAGIALAVVAVWVLYGVRRPVLNGNDAAVAADAPLVAHVRLPRDGSAERHGLPGLRRLLHWLEAAPVDHLALVGTGRSARSRLALAAALPSGQGSPRVVALPGPYGDDLQMDPRRIPALLVVDVGTPAAHVAAVRADMRDDEILGVVLVTRQGRWSRAAGRRDRKRVHLAPRRGAETPVAAQPGASGRALGKVATGHAARPGFSSDA